MTIIKDSKREIHGILKNCRNLNIKLYWQIILNLTMLNTPHFSYPSIAIKFDLHPSITILMSATIYSLIPPLYVQSLPSLSLSLSLFSRFRVSTSVSRPSRPSRISIPLSVDMTIRGIANSFEAWPFKPDRLFYGLHLQSCIVVPPRPLVSSSLPAWFVATLAKEFFASCSRTHTAARLFLSIRGCTRESTRDTRADTRVYTHGRDIPYRCTETHPERASA